MRKIMLKICIVPLMLLASCQDWLDVQPKAEIKLDVMFETEQGFKDALVGCYIMMSDNSLYGAEMTCTFLDVLAQQYALQGSSSGAYYNASRYMYTAANCESKINAIWSKTYNIIANVNALIEGLENNRDKLHPSIYAMTKAEAYGIRAYLYFDLVRLFTWGNLSQRPEVLDKLSLPYVKVYDKGIVVQSTLRKVLEYLHDDLNIALELFDVYDPDSKSGNRPDDYELPNDDKFYEAENRVFRMNLKAARALEMRIYMWEGNYEEAHKSAVKVEELELKFATKLDEDERYRDLTFSEEMLFGLEANKRFDNVVKSYFKLTVADDANINYDALYLGNTRVEDLYEIKTGIGASDWRYTRWWDKSTNDYCFLKFWEYEDMKFINRVPLIRSSEVYYTLAECILRLGKDKDEAILLLNKVRNARNIPSSLNLSNELTSEEVMKELEKEWRKDFIGDGQLFYYYKRLGFTSIPNGPAMAYDDNVYVLPMPQLEIDFGGREPMVDKEK
ncbi:MAG: RagB/SusD family nutrient uptake outer membrane protein [Odoribacter sp.]|nr:RagB/SusD family nutrient uptake outer membrane protein [Odoribacter sp.]MDY3032450.1 RagB/SusD family nutrient uptake outer membrane protein [Odoribacter sp.]